MDLGEKFTRPRGTLVTPPVDVLSMNLVSLEALFRHTSE